jgi:sigma-B regulation protein RsbU (phosphoserine phosphatase)
MGPSNLPLGLLEVSAYDQFDIALEPGDRVLSYTDALMESNDASGEMLGEKGVLQILRLLGDLEPRILIDTCSRRLRSATRGISPKTM